MSAVVFLIGNSMAGAVGGIGLSYRTAFEALGYEFMAIDLTDKDNAVPQLNSLGRKKVEFAFSFMMMGSDIKVDLPGGGGSGDLWRMLHIPYVSLYGDTPAYFFDRHVVPDSSYVSLYGFPEHFEFRKRFAGINGLINTYPPTAIDVVPKNEVDFKKKSGGEIIILKNGNDPKKLIDLWSGPAIAPKVGAALLEIAADLRARMDDVATTQLDDIVQDYFKGINVDITALPRLRLFVVAQLDDYLRRCKSVLLVESLLDMPVLLNGYNWDHIDFTGRRMKYIPGGNYNASTGMIRDCLATIDMSPNTGLAPHDRPLRAIGAHTLCLTNRQEFFVRELPHSEDYFYSFAAESIRARVADVLSHPDRYLEIGSTVAEAFMQKFPAERFAKQLLGTAPFARFDLLPGPPEGTPNYFAWPPSKL